MTSDRLAQLLIDLDGFHPAVEILAAWTYQVAEGRKRGKSTLQAQERADRVIRKAAKDGTFGDLPR